MTPTTDPLREWFAEHDWCDDARRWYDSLPAADRSPERIWALCDRGDHLLWWHEQAGTASEMLAPVAYRAADRACRRVLPAALQAAGLTTEAEALRNLPQIVDRESARAAREAAGAAGEAAGAAGEAAEAAGEAAGAAGDAAEAAGDAARAAWDAAWDAGAAAGDAGDAELRRCAEDCRELLEQPTEPGA